ncbi:MBL fold metallo-hydrolase [Actinokineospora globicatena]|uniref:MBL fold metallo-hydrolase n=1 Tax=Actinokineospora globicatena TaxID=103729 RepID=UPI0020A25D90|nr:MBL fold metallo-hydrolase [Actinokineospora globicatena]MCP2304098.1 Ribonuclease BN, tRNA processing enzyme [Actinokineospora globicatena]GLW78550.1 MBL fold metallo-hydrolase [Actinokineospora globicatena]GLW84786.1 MBL fold metallo-hydrolase [Actinokineospora globicatena]
MQLVVLGCVTPYPAPGQPCSGYLVSDGDTHIVLDCGSGTFAALQDHLPPAEVTALWISHLHPDHSADLLAWSNWALNTPDAPRITVYGPPGWAQRLNHMLTGTLDTTLVDSIFDAYELRDHHTAVHGSLTLTTRAVEHSVPGFGVRVEGSNTCLAYSGDTEPCDAITDLARDADLFLCEAGAAVPGRHHTTPYQAEQTAITAGVHHLLLTHLALALDATAVARSPAIPTTIATPGQRWPSTQNRDRPDRASHTAANSIT